MASKPTKKRIWVLRLDGLRLRFAYHVLPERFRAASADGWISQMERDTKLIKASTREIAELTKDLERGL